MRRGSPLTRLRRAHVRPHRSSGHEGSCAEPFALVDGDAPAPFLRKAPAHRESATESLSNDQDRFTAGHLELHQLIHGG